MRQISPQEHLQLQNEFIAVLGTTTSSTPLDDRNRSPFENWRERDADPQLETPRVLEAAARVGMYFWSLVVSAFCCFWMVFVLFVVYAAILGLEYSSEDDWVSLPVDGAALELTGAPADEIKLRLFRAESSPDDGKSSAYLQVMDAESGFQTTLPARFEAGEPDAEGVRDIYARIVVPGEPGRNAANLSGTLWGEVVFNNGEPRGVEVPVNLYVVQHGEVETSGHRDNSGGAGTVFAYLLFGLATGVMTALVYADWLEKRSESWIARLTQST